MENIRCLERLDGGTFLKKADDKDKGVKSTFARAKLLVERFFSQHRSLHTFSELSEHLRGAPNAFKLGTIP